MLQSVPDNAVTVVVLGPPGLDRDVIIDTLKSANLVASSLPASSVAYATFDVLVLMSPRSRDWELLESVSPCGVVVICDDETDHLAAVLRGADAVVGFDESTMRLVESIHAVAAGGAVLDKRLARAVVQTARDAALPPSPAGARLSKRESEVLRAAARGESSRQTARVLGVSAKTVEELQRRAVRKLGAKSRAHAVALLTASAHIDDVRAAASG